MQPAAVGLRNHASLAAVPHDECARHYGYRSAGDDTILKMYKATLEVHSDVRTLEMQARRGVPEQYNGELMHLGGDHCVPVAKAIKVGPEYPDRAVFATASAQTKCIHSIDLVPNTGYDAIQHRMQELGERCPPRLWVVDNAPNNFTDYARDLRCIMSSQDMIHLTRRILGTLDPAVKTLLGTFSKELSACILEFEPDSIRAIKTRLMNPAGAADGLAVGGKYTYVVDIPPSWTPRDALWADVKTKQRTLAQGDLLTAREVEAMIAHGCFFSTFHDNLRKQWRDWVNIKGDLEAIANKLDPTHSSYDSTYGVVKIKGEERCLFTSKTMDTLRRQACNAKYFQRPDDMPRYRARRHVIGARDHVPT